MSLQVIGNNGLSVGRLSLQVMDTDNNPAKEVPVEEQKQKKKRNYRKDKPWDGDHIDHWKIEVAPWL